MTLAAPWMLWGLAGLALPIVIHLMDRARSSPQDWPCLRFLKIAHEHSAQRTRLKNILVLLARCLLLALIVMAMAQPYIQREGWAQPADLPTTLVIVLDNSFSMGCRDGAANATGDETRFDRAKKLALAQLANLKINDQVALVLASDRTTALTPRPTRDIEHVRQLITDLKVSQRPTNLGAALAGAFAVGQLDHQEAGRDQDDVEPMLLNRRRAWRHVLLITDMQRSAWDPLIRSKLMDQVTDPLPLTVVAVGNPQTGNRFVRQARMRGIAGGTLDVEVEIASDRTRGAAASGAKATLWIDGRIAGSPEPVPAAARKIRLIAPLPSPGSHSCMVQIDEDALPIDDTYYFSINIGSAGRLVVVDGDPSNIARLAETFYLRAALATIVARGGNMTVEQLAPEQLGETSLTGAGCLILANVPQLDGSALANVENFLRAGGNVFVALGDQIDVEHYNRDWKFLPLKLDRPLGGHARTRAYGMFIDAPAHPIIAGDLDVTAARFFQIIGSNPLTLRDGGTMIATFSNGSPALAEAPFGQRDQDAGKVLLFTSSVDADWSNLPHRRTFVPLVDRIVSHFTRKRLTLRAGRIHEPIRFAGPRTMNHRPITVMAPDKRSQTLNAALDPKTEQAVVDYRDTNQVGIYQVQADADFAIDPLFAVNVDTRESILTRIDSTTLQKAFGEHPVRFMQVQTDDLSRWQVSTGEQLQKDRTELWPWLLVAAFIVFVMETFLANLFTRRQQAAPLATTQYIGRTEMAMARRTG